MVNKNSIKFSLVIVIHKMNFHIPFTVMGLDLGWIKVPRDYNKFAFYKS